MKLFFLISFLFLLINCSFDDKTGIWENENQIIKKENKLFSDFKKISSTKDKFNKIVNLDEKYEFSETIPIKNQSWNDIYFARPDSLINNKCAYEYRKKLGSELAKEEDTNAEASSWFDIPKIPHSSFNLSESNFFNFFLRDIQQKCQKLKNLEDCVKVK